MAPNAALSFGVLSSSARSLRVCRLSLILRKAAYLPDPEGNDIEVYADRPVSRWHGPKGEIRMTTDPLDVQDLLKSAEDTE